MKKIVISLVVICVTIICLTSLLMQRVEAYSDFYKANRRGWFWFEKRYLQDRSLEREMDNKDPAAMLKAFREEIEEAKAAMIMTPSVENTKKYIELQNLMFAKASEVSKNWQAVLLSYPDVNIAKDIQTSQSGISIARGVEKQEKHVAIREFAREYKLLFFYKSTCSYCEPFGDVIELFSRRYGFKVASSTLDGKSIRKFPANTNPDLVSKLNVESVPALFAFSESKRIIMPVISGYGTVDILERNVMFLIEAMKK